jgi:hypothetical protein
MVDRPGASHAVKPNALTDLLCGTHDHSRKIIYCLRGRAIPED